MPLKVWFLDVGDCHSTYFQFADGADLLIDCGAGEKSTAEYLAKITTVDHVLITHPHADHLRSLADVKPKVGAFYSIRTRYYPDPCSKQDKPDFDAYYALRQAATSRDATKKLMVKNDLSGFVKVLAPECPPSSTKTSSELNDASAIVYVSYKDRIFLIPGDNEEASLTQFTKDWKAFQADVLLAPHHGQKSGFLTDFVKHVDPAWVVISSGSKKDYDAYDNYANLARKGVRTTRRYGNITFTVEDNGSLTTSAP